MTSSLLSPYLRQVISGGHVFFWEVCRDRYVIADSVGQQRFPSVETDACGIDDKPPFLLGNPARKRFYAPLRSNPVLHRAFCSLQDEGDILGFASKYGLLGFTTERIIRRRNGKPPLMLLSESLHRWRYELFEMQRLVHLWDMIKKRRFSLISAMISVDDDGLYITLKRRKEMIVGRDSALYKKWQLKGEQPREAAIGYLTSIINKRLEGMVHPQIDPSYREHIYLHPANLLSAMWLMFLWEMIGEVRPCRCPGCNEWFDPKRSTRKTCSDRCRKRMSRKSNSTGQNSLS